MVSAAWEGAQEADAILLVVDARKKKREYLEPILASLAERKERKFLVLNKVDATAKEPCWSGRGTDAQGQFDEVFFVSALTGDGVPELKTRLAALMPEGPWHFPKIRCPTPRRLLAAEITREQIPPASRRTAL
jgi:GTP-binding protein Era